MTSDHDDQFEYDLALSFASRDRDAAEEFASLLHDKGLRIFYDELRSGAPPEGEMLEHLVNLYKRKARYCVLFLSPDYPLKTWTGTEQTQLQQIALRDAHNYIVPIPLDPARTPGDREARRRAMEGVINALDGRWKQTEAHPGPPPESPDLRSGNVPSAHKKP